MKYDLQRSFSSGELSELVYMRNDLGDVYDAGLSLMRNMIPNSRGPATTREGMKYIDRISGVSSARLELFQGVSSYALIIFTNLLITIIRDVNNPVLETQSAPWTEDQLDDISIVAVPDGKTIYLFHPNVQTQKIIDNTDPDSSLTLTNSGNFTVPVGITSVTICLTGGGGGGGTGNVGTAAGGGGGSGSVSSIVTTTPSEVIPIVIGAGGIGGAVGGASGTDGGNSTFTALSALITSFRGFGAPGLNDASGGAGSSGGGNGGAVGVNGGQSTNCAAEVIPGGLAGGTFDGGGAGAGGEGGGIDGGGNNQDGENAISNTGSGGGGGGRGNTRGGNGGSGKCIITWAPTAAGFILSPVAFVSKPANWTGVNWPSCGAYYQGRLWMGGAPDKAEEIWASDPNNPEDLTLDVAPAGAIQESMSKYGDIEWMQGTKSFIVGTINGEYILESDSEILLPAEISVNQQSSYGSASIQSEIIGDQVIYVSPDARRLNAINYEWSKNTWLSSDLTYFSEHITKNLVKDLSWAQHPNKLLWALVENGDLISISYERTNDILGWASHNTQGKIVSIVSGFNGTRSNLIIAIERIDGNIDLEVLNESYKLDSWKEQLSSTPYGQIFYIEGFDHLEGQDVQILVDEITHPNRIVGSESELGAADGVLGRVYLNFVGSNHIVGLQYIPKMVSLPKIEEIQEGNDFMHEKTYTEIAVKLLNSRRPVINGKDTYERFPETPQGSVEPSKTELLIVGNEGWDQDAFIEVSQPLPYFLTVAAIGGQYTAKKL